MTDQEAIAMYQELKDHAEGMLEKLTEIANSNHQPDVGLAMHSAAISMFTTSINAFVYLHDVELRAGHDVSEWPSNLEGLQRKLAALWDASMKSGRLDS